MGKRQVLLFCIPVLVGCGGAPRDASVLPPDTLYLEITDTIGEMSGNDTLMFGFLTDCAVTPGGNLAVLDTQKTMIQVFSPDGSQLLGMGGPGSAPGELLLPVSLAVLPNGFAVNDLMGGKVVFYDAEGVLQRELSGFFPTPPVSIRGMSDGRLLGMGMVMDLHAEEGPSAGLAVAAWDTSATPFTVFHSHEIRITGTGTRAQPNFHIAAGLEGTAYLAEESDSLLLVMGFGPEGESVLTIREEFRRVPRSPEELERESVSISLNISNGETTVQRHRNRTTHLYRTIVTGLGVDLLGRIWLQMGDTGETYFRVYEPDGTLTSVAFLRYPETLSDASFSITPYGFSAFEPDPEDWPKVYLLQTSQ